MTNSRLTYSEVWVGGDTRVDSTNVGPLKEQHSLIQTVDGVNGNGS